MVKGGKNIVKACYTKEGLKKGTWSAEEDQILASYVQRFGHWNWRAVPKQAGLQRCGKSCRFRWLNYLRPGIKRGDYSKEEEDVIISLHKQLGNRWSAIANCLPGRTDNEIKNHWHTHLKWRSKENQAMTAKTQRSVENSASCADKERDFQPTPLQMILEEYPVHDLTHPWSLSSNLALDNAFSALNSEEPNEAVADQFMQLERSCQLGSSFSSQSLLVEFSTAQECSSSTLEDSFLQFPLSPLSLGEYDCMGVNYYEGEGVMPYII